MAASSLDKFKKARRKFSTRVGTGGITNAGTTLPLQSVAGIDTDTGVIVVVDAMDSAGNLTPEREEVIAGVVSGSTLINCQRGLEGTTPIAHLQNAVVTMYFTESHWDGLIDGILVGHNQDGTHKNLSADTLTDGTTNKTYTAAEKTKLAGIATGATANSTDATLLNRANHTGTQTADTITDGTTNKAYTATEKTKLAAISGTNTGDETTATIKTKLGVTTLSGSNTGDQDLSALATKASLATVATTGSYTDLINRPVFGGSIATDSDVVLNNPAQNEVLTYNFTTKKWENKPVAVGATNTAFVNVKDFGAKGDNSTNDTTAIQSAINAALAKGGGTVYFPAGTYLISSALKCTSASATQGGVGITLRGDGHSASTIAKNASGFVAVTWNGNGGPDVHPTSYGGLIDISIEGRATSGGLVQTNSANQMFFRGFSLNGGTGFAMDLNTTQDSSFIQWSSNSVHSSSAPIVRIYGSSVGNTNQMFFDSFRIEDFYGTAIKVEAGAGNGGTNDGFYFSNMKLETGNVSGDFFVADTSILNLHIIRAFGSANSYKAGYSTPASFITTGASQSASYRDIWFGDNIGGQVAALNVTPSGGDFGRIVAENIFYNGDGNTATIKFSSTISNAGWTIMGCGTSGSKPILAGTLPYNLVELNNDTYGGGKFLGPVTLGSDVKLTGAGTPAAGKVLTSDATGGATWQTASGGTPADATTAAKGIIKLAGDLGGTALLPTVPALANKANTASPTFTGTVTAHDETLTVANTDNKVALTVTQNDTTNNPRAISVANTGTGNSLYISASATTSTSTSGGGVVVVDSSGNAGGYGVNLYSKNNTPGQMLMVNADSPNNTNTNGSQTMSTASTTLTVTSTSGFPTSGTIIVHNSTSYGTNNETIYLHYTSTTSTTFVGTAGAFYKGSAPVTLVTNAKVMQVSTDSSVKTFITDSSASGGAANIKLASPNPDIEFTGVGGYNNSIGEGQFELDIPVGDNVNRTSTDVFRINGRNDANSSFDTIASFTRPGATGQGMVGIGFQNKTSPTTMAAHLHIKNDTFLGDTNAAALVGEIIQGASGQTANLLEFRNHGSTTPTASVAADGSITTPAIKVTGGTPASGKVLTSDAAGNATWQTAPGAGAGSGDMTKAVYDPANKNAQLAADSEVVKKTGSSMTGDLTISKVTPTLSLTDTTSGNAYYFKNDGNLHIGHALGTNVWMDSDLLPSGSRILGSSGNYWLNLYATRQYLNSTAYLDGATAGIVAVTGDMTVGPNLTLVNSSGYIYTSGGLANKATVNNAFVYPNASGTVISRNIADAGTALTVNQVNAGSTGLIFDAQAGGVSKMSLNTAGTLLVGGVDVTFTLGQKASLTGTETLTNKTMSGASNTFSNIPMSAITGALPVSQGGTGATANTGTGNNVLATSPTLVTPTLGAATATTVNKVTITAPTTSATLTLAQGSTLATAGAFSTTLTATAATNVTLPTTGTLSAVAGAETLTNKRITKRVLTLSVATSTYTPAGDTTDIALITSPAAAYTIANPTGTPTDGQQLTIRCKSSATAYGITWGTLYQSSGIATLPTTSVASKTITMGFVYDAAQIKWVLMAADTVGY